MSETYCTFLRGVNIGRKTIKMDALKSVFEGMGFGSVKTVLATGNVLFKSEKTDAAVLKKAIEARLSAAFDYEAFIFLRDRAQVKAICADAGAQTVPEGCHQYALILDSAALADELRRLFMEKALGAGETLAVTPSAVFWTVMKNETLSSEFGSKMLGAKRYKSQLTSRNMNTVEKIRGAMERLG